MSSSGLRATFCRSRGQSAVRPGCEAGPREPVSGRSLHRGGAIPSEDDRDHDQADGLGEADGTGHRARIGAQELEREPADGVREGDGAEARPLGGTSGEREAEPDHQGAQRDLEGGDGDDGQRVRRVGVDEAGLDLVDEGRGAGLVGDAPGTVARVAEAAAAREAAEATDRDEHARRGGERVERPEAERPRDPRDRERRPEEGAVRSEPARCERLHPSASERSRQAQERVQRGPAEGAARRHRDQEPPRRSPDSAEAERKQRKRRTPSDRQAREERHESALIHERGQIPSALPSKARHPGGTRLARNVTNESPMREQAFDEQRSERDRESDARAATRRRGLRMAMQVAFVAVGTAGGALALTAEADESQPVASEAEPPPALAPSGWSCSISRGPAAPPPVDGDELLAILAEVPS